MAARKWGKENEEALSNENRVSRLWIFDHWMMGIEERGSCVQSMRHTLNQQLQTCKMKTVLQSGWTTAWLFNIFGLHTWQWCRWHILYPWSFFYVILCHVHNNLYNYVFVLLTIKPHPPKKMNNFSVMKLKKKHRSWDSTSCPTNKINEEPVRRPSWWRHLLLSMLSWVQFLEPTRWKKRRDSLKLSSHLYIHAGAYIIHMHK